MDEFVNVNTNCFSKSDHVLKFVHAGICLQLQLTLFEKSLLWMLRANDEVKSLTALSKVSGLSPRFNAWKILNGVVEVRHNIESIRIGRKSRLITHGVLSRSNKRLIKSWLCCRSVHNVLLISIVELVITGFSGATLSEDFLCFELSVKMIGSIVVWASAFGDRWLSWLLFSYPKMTSYFLWRYLYWREASYQRFCLSLLMLNIQNYVCSANYSLFIFFEIWGFAVGLCVFLLWSMVWISLLKLYNVKKISWSIVKLK